MLDRVGLHEVVCVAREHVFRRLRLVKSEAELAMMRVAGDNSARATMAAPGA